MINKNGAKTDFLWKVFLNINELIRFADTKAAALLVIQGVVITIGVPQVIASKEYIINDLFQIICLLFGSVTLIASCVICIICLIPNLSLISTDSFIFFQPIAKKYKSGKAYIDNFPLGEKKINEEIGNEIVINSKIAVKKYKRVSVALKLFIMSVLIISLGVLSTFTGCMKKIIGMIP